VASPVSSSSGTGDAVVVGFDFRDGIAVNSKSPLYSQALKWCTDEETVDVQYWESEKE
jgi:hypothetical protein